MKTDYDIGAATPSNDPSAPGMPGVYRETLGGAMIDAARISVQGALALLQLPPRIVLPGDPDLPSLEDCLLQAANWLDAARALACDQAPSAPTSVHVVERGGVR